MGKIYGVNGNNGNPDGDSQYTNLCDPSLTLRNNLIPNPYVNMSRWR